MCYCYIYNELNALYVVERYRVQSNKFISVNRIVKCISPQRASAFLWK